MTTPALLGHAQRLTSLHLKDLLKDEKRTDALTRVHDFGHSKIRLDASRSKLDQLVLKELVSLAESSNLQQKVEAMFAGKKINKTEDRAVLHVALRSEPGDKFQEEGSKDDVTADVHKVLKAIQGFSNKVRSGELKGHAGKKLTNIICIGIGGSYLGVEFVYESLRTDPTAAKASKGMTLRFLANVDPIDVERATRDLDVEQTLVVIISKTFTTAETILNAKTLKQWILSHYKNDQKAIAAHMCAVSTNLEASSAFGIANASVFGFKDWVGGRFSVCSAVGVLPLSLIYGFDVVSQFLEGARAMDQHFRNTWGEKVLDNLPVLLGLISFWNSTYLDYNCVAVLPYCQALLRFPAHIQQLTMESNGKRVTVGGDVLKCQSGEIYFGEPGTNGQHSFYQLIHQGRVIPCEFIGFTKSQNPIKLDTEPLGNHDELMCNFFAQPDALAMGKSEDDLQKENCPAELIPHKVFTGNRPSTTILFNGSCDAFNVGCLLSLYEHRTAVEGFMWDVNSFDQWGVQLGKVMAGDVRKILSAKVSGAKADTSGLTYATRNALDFYTE